MIATVVLAPVTSASVMFGFASLVAMAVVTLIVVGLARGSSQWRIAIVVAIVLAIGLAWASPVFAFPKPCWDVWPMCWF